MSKRTQIRWINRDLVESPYYIGLCTNRKAFKSEMRRLKVDNPPEWIPSDKDGTVHLLERASGKFIAIACIRKHKNNLELVGLVIHEAVHIWQEIKGALNEPNPSPEFEAYAIQTIAQRLIQKCKRG